MTLDTLIVISLALAAMIAEAIFFTTWHERRRTLVIRKDKDTGEEYVEALRPPRNNVEVVGEPELEDVEDAWKPKEVLDFEDGFSKPGK